MKGPIANAVVSVYKFNPAAENYLGTLVASAFTNDRAQIEGLNIPENVEGPVIIEVLADERSVDISTNQLPAVRKLYLLADTNDIRGRAVYPSPITTLIFHLTVAQADATNGIYTGDNDGHITSSEVLAALPLATRQAISALGFGMPVSDTAGLQAPLVTPEITTPAAMERVAIERTAIEALAAIVDTLKNEINQGLTGNDILAALADDLTDSVIDGRSKSGEIEMMSDLMSGRTVRGIVTSDPKKLQVPRASTMVTDIEEMLLAEAAITGPGVDLSLLEGGNRLADPKTSRGAADMDDDGIEDFRDPEPTVPLDTDRDGVTDIRDAFPQDPTEWSDADGDGVGDNRDNCIHVVNPDQANHDTDADGDACDLDDDNDGMSDEEERVAGTDATKADTDGDGVNDLHDRFPTDPTETKDSDGDSVGDNRDDFPHDPTRSADTDGDGYADHEDAFPDDPAEHMDTDGDGVGDNGDAFPQNPAESRDTDADGVGDIQDNCPEAANANQADTDGDGVGDVCDEPKPGEWNQTQWNGDLWR